MGGEYQQQFQQMNAMAPMAMNMGQQFLGAQTEMLKQKADQYIPTTKLRYLFAVDNSYVFQKLKIITLPWLHSDWMLKYQTDVNNPVAPRYVFFKYKLSCQVNKQFNIHFNLFHFYKETMLMHMTCTSRAWPSSPTSFSPGCHWVPKASLSRKRSVRLWVPRLGGSC